MRKKRTWKFDGKTFHSRIYSLPLLFSLSLYSLLSPSTLSFFSVSVLISVHRTRSILLKDGHCITCVYGAYKIQCVGNQVIIHWFKVLEHFSFGKITSGPLLFGIHKSIKICYDTPVYSRFWCRVYILWWTVISFNSNLLFSCSILGGSQRSYTRFIWTLCWLCCSCQRLRECTLELYVQSVEGWVRNLC